MTKIFIGTFPSDYGHTAIPEGAVEAAVKAANAALDLEQEQQRRQGDTAGRFAEAGEHQTRAHDAPLQARPGGARVKDETMTDVSTRPAARPIGIDRVFALNHVPTFQVADQNAIKIIQVVMKDDGNSRPFCIVAKNLSTSMIATFLPVS